MLVIINKSILMAAVCSILLMISGTLCAMEQNNLGKIPLEGFLTGIAACGSSFLVYGNKSERNYPGYLNKYDLMGNKEKFYDLKGLKIEKIFVLNDSEVILIYQNDCRVSKLNLNTGDNTFLFKEPSRGEENLSWYFMLNNNRIGFGFTDNHIKICDGTTGQSIKEFTLDRTLLRGWNIADDQNRIYQFNTEDKLRVFSIDAEKYIEEIDIPVRQNNSGQKIYVSKICYLDTNDMALAWDDGYISIWNLEAKEQVQEFQAHNGYISSIINIGKGYFVTGGPDGLVKTWHKSNKQCQYSFDGHLNDGPNKFDCQISKLALLPGGRIASGTDKNIQISKVLVCKNIRQHGG